MKRTKAIKMFLVVICMLAAGICYAGTKKDTAVSLLDRELTQQDTVCAEDSGEGRGAVPENGRGGNTGAGSAAKSTEPDGGMSGIMADRENGDQAGDGLAGTAGAQGCDPDTEEKLCYVYICGEVELPGVYPMAEGSRVYQVVDRAGGFTEAAAAEYLNMADLVEDGLKLVVPAAGELPDEERYGDIRKVQAGQKEGSAVKTKVNLNTAGKEALMTLTGIGEARAEDIIRYRTEQGPFRTIEDVMKISGIKDAAFQKIKNDITV